ncbi:hypothetical protein [Limosilactobacillus reuteri]|uniref:hypothetical protein n=2 Tax=Limosilactobacillus reuteri TaxID=1598 RepID=UPI00128CDA8A|nr:hypothetical protein [Limosilactobacillus reuteri]MDD1381323.1 hypothetical protein [Limosilactobacillus reuteri]MQB66336.1 hypothetical protein [Limosilactobacillus reuteri]
MDNNETINYIRDVLRYTLFSDTTQNNEYIIEMTKHGIIFIPVYPITYLIDEKFYNRLFNILSLALMPDFTLIRPLTMQVITLRDRPLSEKRGLFFPIIKGQAQRLKCTFSQLIQLFHQSGEIPLMDTVTWDYVHSPFACIVGVSGSGKSYFMKTLLAVCSIIGDTIVVDPKASDLARMTRTRPASKAIIPNFSENAQQGINNQFLGKVIAQMKRLETEMYKRQGLLFQQSKKISTDYRELGLKPIFLFLEEVGSLVVGATKTMRDDFQKTLTKLVLLGRESGVYTLMSMQSARAEYIPTIVKDSISLRVQLGRLNSENTRFLFPELTDMPIVPLGGNGTGIMSIAGDSRYAGIQPIATPTIVGD